MSLVLPKITIGSDRGTFQLSPQPISAKNEQNVSDIIRYEVGHVIAFVI